MRWVRDLVMILLLVAVGGGALAYQRMHRDREAQIQLAAAELRRLELEVKYRAATGGTQVNPRGWPMTIDPAWFEQNPPRNCLLTQDRPWVEVASMEESGLTHPPVRMAVDDTVAEFWYNPAQGIVRARVPVMVSDERATELYNRLNGTSISSIFFNEKPAPDAEPVPPAAGTQTSEPAKSGGGTPQAAADSPPRREPMMVHVERPGDRKKKRN